MYMQLSAAVFNAGCTVPLLMYFAAYNTERIDLSQKSALNFRGAGMTAKNFLLTVPMFLPPAFVGVMSQFSSVTVALWILGILGAVGIVCHKPIIALCTNRFNQRKYILTEGMREK
jgi:hypothetical protein